MKNKLKWASLLSATTVAFWSVGFFSGPLTSGKRSLSSLSSGHSADTGSRITRDAALYDRIKQLDLHRSPTPSFDDELSRLAAQESRYHEKLPGLSGHPRLRSVVKRVSAGSYSARSRSAR
ncbi:MAG: hypothetical protein ACK5QT_11635 [Oligoflexia bacterium]